MEITIEVCTYLFDWKLNYNYNKIPRSVEMRSKQQDKICGISKTKYVVFYYNIPTIILTFHNCVSKNEFFFLRNSIFG
jgi:hypothetical protein